MKFISSVAAIVSIATTVEGSFRGAKHASDNKREERTRQLMMNPGGGGGSMGGGGGGGGDRDGCPDFRKGIPIDMMCSSNADCVAPACCVQYTVPFCHASPWECNSSLQCLAPNEVDAGVNIGLPGQPGTGTGTTPVAANGEQHIQVYEDRNGNEVVEIMSQQEDIKVYQNAAGDEVVEIANIGAPAAPLQKHAVQQVSDRPLMHPSKDVVQAQDNMAPQSFSQDSGDGSSPDSLTGDCDLDEIYVYMYMELFPEDGFNSAGRIKLVEEGDKSSRDDDIWDEYEFGVPDKDGTEYVGEECLDRSGCYKFIVEYEGNNEAFEEGMISFYTNGIEKMNIDEDGVEYLNGVDTTTSFDDEPEEFEFGLGC